MSSAGQRAAAKECHGSSESVKIKPNAYTSTMSGKAQAGIDPISHDSATVRRRLAIALRRAALRSELKFYATAQASLDGHSVKQRASESVIEEKQVRC